MAKKYNEPPLNKNPGPGEYKEKSRLNLKGRTFANETRENKLILKELTQTPAPGSYV